MSGRSPPCAVGPSLYEFLLEAELSEYYMSLKNDLKVSSVGQLKYVEDGDLSHVGMSRPEQRRLRKYFHKYYPHSYLGKIKQLFLGGGSNKLEDGDKDLSSCKLLQHNDEQMQQNSHQQDRTTLPSKHLISADSIVVNKELGVGEFGVVQQGTWTNDEGIRVQVAIKCLSKERMQSNPEEFFKEAAIMYSVAHKHIVRLHGVVEPTSHGGEYMLVTELAPLRSLLECLKEPSLRSSFPVSTLCQFAVQICDGMAYLESNRLIHRDLAARNILVFGKDLVKISDFGLSRALGVGKDYYQTNFNVNLKLPIAWCAPECINYLRFTSASDVWAYGVTLWEMFSYGFQPWPALTGQQILEAIDEPNYQRLEQPDCCPRDYYHNVMLQCWKHDANSRPRFADLLMLLPDCKPEQLQAVKNWDDAPNVLKRKDALVFAAGDIITVLDKRPLTDPVGVFWKGVTTHGKTGLFHPSITIAYFTLASASTFARRGAGSYSSSRLRQKLRRDMISAPQGDVRHTGHVGIDGAFFGDVTTFFGKDSSGGTPGSQVPLPRQIVAPYKPHEDKFLLQDASSDRTPLLHNGDEKSDAWCSSPGAVSESRMPLLSNSSDTSTTNKPVITSGAGSINHHHNHRPGGATGADAPHEYHEISDDEFGPRFDSLDLGPSLLDEVFRALGSSDGGSFEMPTHHSAAQGGSTSSTSTIEPLRDASSKPLIRPSKHKNHHSSHHHHHNHHDKPRVDVKPISSALEHTLDSAIAMAKELASKTIQDSETESPRTPSSPTKKGNKFTFMFNKSPKAERRHFSDKVQHIHDVQEGLTDTAKDAYRNLVEKGKSNSSGSGSNGISSGSGHHHHHHYHNTGPASSDGEHDGGMHHFRGSMRNGGFSRPIGGSMRVSGNGVSSSYPRQSYKHHAAGSSSDSANVLPLPPKPASVPSSQSLKHHQRKHPLMIPGASSSLDTDVNDGSDDGTAGAMQTATTNGAAAILNPPASVLSASAPSSSNTACMSLPPYSSSMMQSTASSDTVPSSSAIGFRSRSSPPPKPQRAANTNLRHVLSTDMNAIPRVVGATVNMTGTVHAVPVIPTNGTPPVSRAATLTRTPDVTSLVVTPIDVAAPLPGALVKKAEHVSCEDLMEFAMDRPNAKRTQGRAHGIDSDEVHIMQKVLVKENVSPETCVAALESTDWEVHHAIKWIRLELRLPAAVMASFSPERRHSALIASGWDVDDALKLLLSHPPSTTSSTSSSCDVTT